MYGVHWHSPPRSFQLLTLAVYSPHYKRRKAGAERGLEVGVEVSKVWRKWEWLEVSMLWSWAWLEVERVRDENGSGGGSD